MNRFVQKNKADWDAGAQRYGQFELTPEKLQKIVAQPQSAFDPAVWAMLHSVLPDLSGKRICVPSSGNNHAVFAFALLGAQVTSCDISEKQLENAARAAREMNLSIDFVPADTMALDGLPREAFDLVYTSNGVHVWINDLPAMYAAIASLLKPGGFYALYEIHPFQRPFDEKTLDALRVVKPYDAIGPFEDETTVTFAWRVSDILNALAGSGLRLLRMEEIQPLVDYEEPFWIPLEQLLADMGHDMRREEIDRLYDWRINPHAALPQMMAAIASK